MRICTLLFLAAFFVGGLVISTASTNAALVSHWAFDDGSGMTATDSAGANDGILGPQGLNVGQGAWDYTAPDWVTGKIGGALAFSGGSYPGPGDAVQVPDAPSLNSLDFSVSVWINTAQTANFVGYVTKGWGHNIGDPGGWMIDSNNGARAQVSSDTVAYTATAATSIADGAWHSVVATYDGASGSLRAYVDGILIDTQTGTLGLTVKDVMIGGDGYSTILYSGLLDDIGYWSSTLTEGQAKSLYGLGDSSLNYDLKAAQRLWDLHEAGAGSVEVGGLTWYPTTGLGGGLGAVEESAGAFYLQLCTDGTGVTTTPEPSVLVLLLFTAAVLGLLRTRR
jgi:hypothetical protein